jgi:hypothetical protein
MNKIHKIIRYPSTGHAVAAPECARSRGKSGRQGPARGRRGNGALCLIANAGAALALALPADGAFAQGLIYDGSNDPGTASLEPLATGSSSPLNWMTGLTAADQGVIYRTGGATAAAGADLTIVAVSGTEPRFVIGGYLEDGTETVEGNTVTMVRGNVHGSVHGGLSHRTSFVADADGSGASGGDASAATDVNLADQAARAHGNGVAATEGAAVAGGLYGGRAMIALHAGKATAGAGSAANADAHADGSRTMAGADGNTVAVDGGATVGGNVSGGHAAIAVRADDAAGGAATEAVADSSAGTSARADSAVARADGNTVAIKEGGSVTGDLHGGHAGIAASAGKALGGTASGTTHAYADADTYASARNSSVHAGNNKVILHGGANVIGSLYGGQAAAAVYADAARGGEATGEAGATVTSIVSSFVDISGSRVSSDDNTVTVDGGATVAGNLYGGHASLEARAGHATSGTADASSADVRTDAKDSTVGADRNAVAIDRDALVTGSLYGGHASLDTWAGHAALVAATGAYAFAGVDVTGSRVSASGNAVTLDGRLQEGSVYGGYVRFQSVQGTADASASGGTAVAGVLSSGSRAQATDNTVTIGDHATLSGDVSLYGGFLDYNTAEGHRPESYDVFSGNTLNFSAQPVSVHTVANFEKYNFTLQPALANQPTALIGAQQIVLGSNADNLDSAQAAKASEIKVVGIHSGNALSASDQFVLMRAADLSGSGTGLTSTGVAQQGVSLLYDVQTAVDLPGNMVIAEILACQSAAGGACSDGAARVNPQLKALSEGYLGGAMLVARGADHIADEAFDAIAAQASGSGASSFALASASRSRYASGSHVTSNDQFLAAGLGVRQEVVTVAAFVEGGWGNYDSHNSFYNAASVDGDGNTHYYGAGLLGRYAFTGGFYTEASLRAGKTRLSFDTGDLQNLATGEFARYRLHSRYVSAHLGVGYELPLTTDQTLDLSAKYLGSRVGGKHVTVAGDPLHFERVDSQRLRLNAELAHRYSPAVMLKAGLGYEREFDGEAKATTYGSYKIEAPSVKGGTGLLSLGASVRPTASRNLTLDFAATGYAGQRDGGGASVQVQYRF